MGVALSTYPTSKNPYAYSNATQCKGSYGKYSILQSSIKTFMIDSDQRINTGRIITENQKGSIPFLAKLVVSVWSTD